MSPSTAAIHKANMTPHASTQRTTAQPSPTTSSTSPPPADLTPSTISTPSFYALPLSITIPASLYLPTSSLSPPPRSSLSTLPALSPAPPPSTPAQQLISSRGRPIKLREHSIHLHRPSASPTLAYSSSPPPHSVSPPPLPPPPPPSSPTVRFHCHQWCLWQLRAEYLLGEVRRKLKKQAGAGGRSAPSTPVVKGESGGWSAEGGGERATPKVDGRGRWKRKLAEELKHVGQAAAHNGVGSEEERKWTGPHPSLPSPLQTPATPSASSAYPSPVFPSPPALPSPLALSPAASLPSITSAIPPHHTLLTLPLISVLSTTVSSLTLPPDPSTLPFCSALASCLLLPTPPRLSSLTPAHYDAPHSFNYDSDRGGSVVDGVWRMPHARVTVAYEEVEEGERREGQDRKGEVGAGVRGKATGKGTGFKRKAHRKVQQEAEGEGEAVVAGQSREVRMAERARKEKEREERAKANPPHHRPRTPKKLRAETSTETEEREDTAAALTPNAGEDR